MTEIKRERVYVCDQCGTEVSSDYPDPPWLTISQFGTVTRGDPIPGDTNQLHFHQWACLRAWLAERP